jgi:hypothetical protein
MTDTTQNETKSLKSEPYLIDVEKLQKGDYISPLKCADALNITPDDPQYDLKIMTLKQQIENELLAIGNIWTLKMECGGIRILKDSEATDYNQRQLEISVNRMKRAHNRQLGVDCNELSTKEIAVHNRRLTTHGAIIISIEETKRRTNSLPELKAYERDKLE